MKNTIIQFNLSSPVQVRPFAPPNENLSFADQVKILPFGNCAAAAATKTHWSLPKGFCNGLDAAYYDTLMNRTAQYSTGDKRLCLEVGPQGQHDIDRNSNKSCTCHHPFLPIAQDASPDWKSVVNMNIEYMETTYSVLQPDVVLYGDSITEHLLGRNFGLFHKKYHEVGEVSHSLLRRREGGKINGLPMAVSGDQVCLKLFEKRVYSVHV